jgi:hypothetical protein
MPMGHHFLAWMQLRKSPGRSVVTGMDIVGPEPIIGHFIRGTKDIFFFNLKIFF